MWGLVGKVGMDVDTGGKHGWVYRWEGVSMCNQVIGSDLMWARVEGWGRVWSGREKKLRWL